MRDDDLVSGRRTVLIVASDYDRTPTFGVDVPRLDRAWQVKLYRAPKMDVNKQRTIAGRTVGMTFGVALTVRVANVQIVWRTAVTNDIYALADWHVMAKILPGSEYVSADHPQHTPETARHSAQVIRQATANAIARRYTPEAMARMGFRPEEVAEAQRAAASVAASEIDELFGGVLGV